jgi:hypothetical protein
MLPASNETDDSIFSLALMARIQISLEAGSICLVTQRKEVGINVIPKIVGKIHRGTWTLFSVHRYEENLKIAPRAEPVYLPPKLTTSAT